MRKNLKTNYDLEKENKKYLKLDNNVNYNEGILCKINC
jgi:hypothetical protein